MREGGRDAGFWVLLVLAAVTALCAAYTLLTVTDLLRATAAAARSAAGAATRDIRSEDTRPETSGHAGAVLEQTTDVEKTAAPEETAAGDAAAPPPVRVTALGDSAMLGAVDTLGQEIPNLVLLDAQGSRQVAAAVDLLRQYRADGHLGDVVVVHIGNNGPVTAEEFDEMMGALADARKVLVVNLTVPPNVPDPIAVPNDAVLAGGVQRYPNKAELVDWRAASAGHPGYFWDGVHLTPRGAQAYAELIASQVGDRKASVASPGSRKVFSWGEDGFSGECVGPSSWCRGVARR